MLRALRGLSVRSQTTMRIPGVSSFYPLDILPESPGLIHVLLVSYNYSTVIGAYVEPKIRAVDGLEVPLSTPTGQVASTSDLRVVATVQTLYIIDFYTDCIP